MKRLHLIALFLFPLLLHAQNTLYFMDRLPQKLSYNPAFVPEIDFYLGLPGIGGVAGNVYNSGFNYGELDYFLDNLSYQNYNPDDFVQSIGQYNRFYSDVQVNLFSFGFKTKRDGYFSMNITENSINNIRAESDIAYLLANLDDLKEEDFPLTIDGIDLASTTYLSFGATYSRKVNENLTLGISPKLNFNQFGIQTKNIGYTIEITQDEFEKNYNQYPRGEIMLGMPVEINPAALNGNELAPEQGIFPENWPGSAGVGDLFSNASFSMDLGASYRLHDWTFSASILNLGSSSYRKNSYRLQGENETIRIYEAGKMRIGIPAKIYLGASHQFSPRWNYGLLLNNTFYKTGSMPSATLSFNGFVGNMLSTSVSYTAGYKFDNLGLGLRLRFLPGTDLFLVTDNIIQAFNYKKAYRFSVAAGINLSIGIRPEPEPANQAN